MDNLVAFDITEVLKNLYVGSIMIAVNVLFLIALIKVFNILVNKIFIKLVEKTEDIETKKRVVTIKTLVKSTINTIIALLVMFNVLSKLNIDIRPLLTAAGVVGIAVGFAAKQFLEDIIMGLFIMLEGQVRVGDVVVIDNKEGMVEKITLRMIILRDLKGHVHYIRNGMINVITNETREYAYSKINIGVSYNSNITQIFEVLKAIAKTMRAEEEYSGRILEDIEIFGLDEFDDSSILIKSRIKTTPHAQWMVTREFNLRMKHKFDELGIEIPFPQLDAHVSMVE